MPFGEGKMIGLHSGCICNRTCTAEYLNQGGGSLTAAVSYFSSSPDKITWIGF